MSDFEIPDEVIESAAKKMLHGIDTLGEYGFWSDLYPMQQADLRKAILATAPTIAAWAREQALAEATEVVEAKLFQSQGDERLVCAEIYAAMKNLQEKEVQ